MISPTLAAQFLVKLVHTIGLSSLQWTILGFSQGGFFAPHLIQQGLKANTIIGVGAAYRLEDYQGLEKVKLFALHGDQDQDVTYQSGKDSFQKMKEAGIGQEFFSLEGVGHTLNEGGRKIVRDILAL